MLNYAISKWSTIFKYYFHLHLGLLCLRLSNLEFNIEVLNLFYYLCCTFHANHHLFQPSFFFKTSLVDLLYCLKSLLFFDIPLLHYYIYPRSSIIFCLSSGDIYLSLVISLLCSFVTVSELIFFCKAFEIFEIYKYSWVS